MNYGGVVPVIEPGNIDELCLATKIPHLCASAAISADNAWVACGSPGEEIVRRLNDDGTVGSNSSVTIWRMSDVAKLATLVEGASESEAGVSRIALSTNNKWLAAVGDGLWVWTTTDWKLVYMNRQIGQPRDVAFSFGNDSLHIVTAESHWSTAELVTLSTTDWSPIQRRQLSTEGTVARLYPHFSLLIDFDPFFVGGPPRARLINLQTGELIREVPQGSRRCAMALDTSGSLLAVPDDGQLIISSVSDNHPVHYLRFSREYGVWSLTFSPDSRLLAAGVFSIEGSHADAGPVDRGCLLWDVQWGAMLRHVELPSDSLLFSPDGSRLMGSRWWQGSASIWQIGAR
jgi:WD40 repeat protein